MSKEKLTIQDVINKLKKKDFSITYEQAIDLAPVMNVSYEWVGLMGRKESKLIYIELNDFSDVKLYIVDDSNG